MFDAVLGDFEEQELATIKAVFSSHKIPLNVLHISSDYKMLHCRNEQEANFAAEVWAMAQVGYSVGDIIKCKPYHDEHILRGDGVFDTLDADTAYQGLIG